MYAAAYFILFFIFSFFELLFYVHLKLTIFFSDAQTIQIYNNLQPSCLSFLPTRHRCANRRLSTMPCLQRLAFTNTLAVWYFFFCLCLNLFVFLGFFFFEFNHNNNYNIKLVMVFHYNCCQVLLNVHLLILSVTCPRLFDFFCFCRFTYYYFFFVRVQTTLTLEQLAASSSASQFSVWLTLEIRISLRACPMLRASK